MYTYQTLILHDLQIEAAIGVYEAAGCTHVDAPSSSRADIHLARRVGRTFHAPPKLDEFRVGPYPVDEVARCVKGSRQRKVGRLRGGGLSGVPTGGDKPRANRQFD